MTSSTIFPIPNNLDAYDGGPPVARKESAGSSMSDGSQQREYYNGEDFDGMIADAMEPTRRAGGGPTHEAYHPANVVDVTPDDDNVNSDLEESDMNSLNSDDISGGSDISDVEEQRNKKDSRSRGNFFAPPLINDDESTVDMRPPAPVNQTVSSYVEALNQQQTRKNRIVRLGLLFIFVGVIIGLILAIVQATGGKNDGAAVDSASGGGGSNGSTLKSNQIGFKEGFVGNATRSPSLSPSYLEHALPTVSPIVVMTLSPTLSPIVVMTLSPTLPPQTALPTSSPTLPPQAALSTSRPTPAPLEVEMIETNDSVLEIIETDAPAISPTPEPTPSPVTDKPTSEPTPLPTPYPTFGPTSLITPEPTPWPTPKPFTITSPPTPLPTPRPVSSPVSPSGPTIYAGGGSPTDGSFHCAEVTYTANWNELLNFDCTAACSGLGMDSECPFSYQCKSDEGSC